MRGRGDEMACLTLGNGGVGCKRLYFDWVLPASGAKVSPAG